MNFILQITMEFRSEIDWKLIDSIQKNWMRGKLKLKQRTFNIMYEIVVVTFNVLGEISFSFLLVIFKRYKTSTDTQHKIKTWYSRAAHSFDTSSIVKIVNKLLLPFVVYLMDWNCWFPSILKNHKFLLRRADKMQLLSCQY